jgi:hypothetical protein
VTPCAVCTVHLETRSVGFLVELQNQGRWFGLKTSRLVFSDLSTKLMATVFSSLGSKPMAMVFSDLGLKLVVMVSTGLASKPVWVSWLSPKTKVIEGFLVCALKPTATVW